MPFVELAQHLIGALARNMARSRRLEGQDHDFALLQEGPV
jgi:hypothetical protein